MWDLICVIEVLKSFFDIVYLVSVLLLEVYGIGMVSVELFVYWVQLIGFRNKKCQMW